MSVDYYDVPCYKGRGLFEVTSVNPISDKIIDTIVKELDKYIVSEEFYIHEQYGLNYVAFIGVHNCEYSEEPEIPDMFECYIPEEIKDVFVKYGYNPDNISIDVDYNYDVG